MLTVGVVKTMHLLYSRDSCKSDKTRPSQQKIALFLGQENGVKLRIVFQELCQELISMKELPLSITNVHGLSPALRSTEVTLLALEFQMVSSVGRKVFLKACK